ncbi:MAG: GNAT family acetyltransferase [Treponema sp.]|nr:GNAT family acetyltransferase [Treponema sp.]
MIALQIGEKIFSVLRLNELSDEAEISEMNKLLLSFSCPLNDEVESFLKNNAFDFSSKNQAVTYLVFQGKRFIAYFTLANKLIQVQKNAVSKSVLKRLLRTAEDSGNEFINVPGILVAQLGKNFTDKNNTLISGTELLDIISYFVKEVQALIGGAVYFLECDSDRQKVIDFYQINGFIFFSQRAAKSDGIQLFQFLKKI